MIASLRFFDIYVNDFKCFLQRAILNIFADNTSITYCSTVSYGAPKRKKYECMIYDVTTNFLIHISIL